jgi:hypothetical protein
MLDGSDFMQRASDEVIGGGGQRRLRGNARSLIIAILALVGTLLSNNSVLAADYSVDFGAETDAGRDAGSLMCRVGETCSADMESLGLYITFLVFRSEPERVTVHLYGRGPGCCYFAGAADSVHVDPRKPLSRMSFYRGARARGALLIENERVGTLYLRFHSR